MMSKQKKKKWPKIYTVLMLFTFPTVRFVCVFKSIQNVYQQQKNHVSEFFVYKISRTEINSLENV